MTKTSRYYSKQEKLSLLFRVCELFLVAGMSAKEVAEQTSKDFNRKINREYVYKLLQEALRGNEKHKLLRLVPPVNLKIERKLREKFSIPESCDINVVDVFNNSACERITETASDIILDYMKELKNEQSVVHLGLGPGYTTRRIAESLGSQMRSLPDQLKVSLHAITAGSPVRRSKYAALSSFGCFSTDMVKNEFPLFTEPVVRVKDYPEVQQHPGYMDAINVREEIQIIITTLGDKKDPHDIYRNLHEGGKKGSKSEKPTNTQAVKDLNAKGWVGNMQFRPYSNTGPIYEANDSQRISTLFELEDYRKWAKEKKKRIVLVVSPCGACQMLRAEALLPLLKPEFRIWNSLVVDRMTAEKCVDVDDGSLS